MKKGTMVGVLDFINKFTLIKKNYFEILTSLYKK